MGRGCHAPLDSPLVYFDHYSRECVYDLPNLPTPTASPSFLRRSPSAASFHSLLHAPVSYLKHCRYLLAVCCVCLSCCCSPATFKGSCHHQNEALVVDHPSASSSHTTPTPHKRANSWLADPLSIAPHIIVTTNPLAFPKEDSSFRLARLIDRHHSLAHPSNLPTPLPWQRHAMVSDLTRRNVRSPSKTRHRY